MLSSARMARTMCSVRSVVGQVDVVLLGDAEPFEWDIHGDLRHAALQRVSPSHCTHILPDHEGEHSGARGRERLAAHVMSQPAVVGAWLHRRGEE
jgi:hypothetical protein